MYLASRHRSCYEAVQIHKFLLTSLSLFFGIHICIHTFQINDVICLDRWDIRSYRSLVAACGACGCSDVVHVEYAWSRNQPASPPSKCLP